jgi:hypothetical protein
VEAVEEGLGFLGTGLGEDVFEIVEGIGGAEGLVGPDAGAEVGVGEEGVAADADGADFGKEIGDGFGCAGVVCEGVEGFFGVEVVQVFLEGVEALLNGRDGIGGGNFGEFDMGLAVGLDDVASGLELVPEFPVAAAGDEVGGIGEDREDGGDFEFVEEVGGLECALDEAVVEDEADFNGDGSVYRTPNSASALSTSGRGSVQSHSGRRYHPGTILDFIFPPRS